MSVALVASVVSLLGEVSKVVAREISPACFPPCNDKLSLRCKVLLRCSDYS